MVVAVLIYVFQTSKRVSAGDFYVVWYATRQMVFEGLNPYSQEVTIGIQVTFAGAPFGPDVKDPLSFNYPLYTTLFLLPFIWFDYPIAEALWGAVNIFALGGAVWAFKQLLGWQNRNPLITFLPYIIAYLSYPFVFTFFFGQYTIVSLFFATLGLLLIHRHMPILGGIILALSLIKPQTGLIVSAFVMFWCLVNWRQSYKAILSAGGVGLGLLLLPMLWLVDWIAYWLPQAAYRRVTPGMYSFDEEMAHHLFGLARDTSTSAGLVVALLIGLSLTWLWSQAGWDSARLANLFALTALLTLLILPQYGFANEIVICPALIILVYRLQKYLTRPLLLILTVVGLFGLFLWCGSRFYFYQQVFYVAVSYVWLGWELWQSVRLRLKPSQVIQPS